MHPAYEERHLQARAVTFIPRRLTAFVLRQSLPFLRPLGVRQMLTHFGHLTALVPPLPSALDDKCIPLLWMLALPAEPEPNPLRPSTIRSDAPASQGQDVAVTLREVREPHFSERAFCRTHSASSAIRFGPC